MATTSSMKLSADRGREIPLDGITLTAVPLRTVTLTDGTAAASTLTSGAVTVGELLAEAGLALGPQDTVTPDATTPVTEGLSVAIARTTVSTVIENVEIPQPADIRTQTPFELVIALFGRQAVAAKELVFDHRLRDRIEQFLIFRQ